MKKMKIVQRIVDEGVVAVLRGGSPEEAVAMAEQAIDGGIKVIEITMTVPFALQAVEVLARKYGPAAPGPGSGAIIGVGTVLDAETARAAILSGAEFVVSPSLNPDTVRTCNRYQVPILPGVMTVKEIQEALELGVDICKLFPGSLYSPSTISAVKGPLPQANLMPTGGVNLANLGDWICAGAVAVGIGSDLTAEAVQRGDMSLIRRKSAEYVAAYRTAKQAAG